jgi:hypothetical protein
VAWFTRPNVEPVPEQSAVARPVGGEPCPVCNRTVGDNTGGPYRNGLTDTVVGPNGSRLPRYHLRMQHCARDRVDLRNSKGGDQRSRKRHRAATHDQAVNLVDPQWLGGFPRQARQLSFARLGECSQCGLAACCTSDDSSRNSLANLVLFAPWVFLANAVKCDVHGGERATIELAFDHVGLSP